MNTTTLSSPKAKSQDEIIGLGERIGQFFKQSPTAIIGDATSAVVLFFILFGTVSTSVLATWFIFAQLLNVYLAYAYIRFRYTEPSSIALYKDWRFSLYIPSLVHGATWGAFSIIAYYSSHEWAYILSLVVIMGLAAGSVSIMASVFPLFVIHKVLLVLPSAFIIAWSGEAGEKWGVIVFIIVFFNSLIFSGLVYYRTLLESMRLRHEKDDIVTSLRREVDTRKRIETRLVEANRKAEQASVAKSNFLANMSHEIRTPLTAIIGFSESIVHDQTIEERIKTANTIARSSKHLLEIINDILDLSKIESNKLDVECINTPVFEILDDLVAISGQQARDKGLNFEIHYQYPVPEIIQSDPVRLKQVLLNLFSNATKFTEKGGIHIDVRYQGENGLLQFNVSDTGIGLTQDQLENIFAAFSQADTSTTRKYGGTGLGLNLSKKLANALGGDLIVSSTPQVGSNFCFTVPVGDIGVGRMIHSESEKPVSESLQKTEQIRLRGRVLIAEDTEIVQTLIGNYLRNVGLEYDVANNGIQAVDKCAETDYDLVLMDIQMPELDGLEATRIIRKRGFKAPIVALTANAFLKDAEKSHDAGMTDFITKPIETEIFYATLAKYLEVDKNASPHKPAITPIRPMLKDTSENGLRMARKFVSDFRMVVNSAIYAYTQGDMDKLVFEVHKIKGSAATFGYPQLSQLAKTTELCIHDKDTANLPSLIEQLGVMYSAIEAGVDQ